MLLRCGASVNLAGPKGITPLMIAAKDRKNMALVETLVDYEADIKAKDARGWDARRYARENGQAEILELLETSLRDQDRGFQLHDDQDYHSFEEDEGGGAAGGGFAGEAGAAGGQAKNDGFGGALGVPLGMAGGELSTVINQKQICTI